MEKQKKLLKKRYRYIIENVIAISVLIGIILLLLCLFTYTSAPCDIRGVKTKQSFDSDCVLGSSSLDIEQLEKLRLRVEQFYDDYNIQIYFITLNPQSLSEPNLDNVTNLIDDTIEEFKKIHDDSIIYCSTELYTDENVNLQRQNKVYYGKELHLSTDARERMNKIFYGPYRNEYLDVMKLLNKLVRPRNTIKIRCHKIFKILFLCELCAVPLILFLLVHRRTYLLNSLEIMKWNEDKDI